VASELVISPRTVNTHLSNIYRKLNTSSREIATRFALEHGLV
jgi:DNA-binding NarL/FixJ family response regulator